MKTKRDTSRYYKFGLYLVITILVILVSRNLFLRLDLTANNLYSLSKASKRSVATLKEPLTINVFFSKNLPAPYNNIERYLHDLLEEYSLHSKKYLSYRFYDVSAKEGDLSEKAEENRKKAQDYGIYPVNVQKIEQDEAKVQRAYMGMVFIHGDIIERIPAIASTEGLEYQITSTIQKMNNKISALLNLPEKIKIKLIQSSSLDLIADHVELVGLDGLKDQVARVVDEMNQKTYGQLEFIRMDPSLEEIEPEELQRYRRFGLQWPELKTESGSVVPANYGILALGMEYGEKSLELRLLNQSLNLTASGFQEKFKIVDMEQLRTFIEENVDNLINIHEEIGYLSSHGTLSLSPALPPQMQMMQPPADSLTRFNSLLSSNYTVTQVNLKDLEIPESIDTLLIAGPKENFSDWELFQIDQFLMKGKSLAFFVEAFNEVQPQGQQQMYGMQQPVYLPVNTGLEKLLDHYGVEVKKSYVMDENCFITRDRTSGETPIYFAPVIKNENINHKLDFLANIKELVIIKASPVEINQEKTKDNSLVPRELFSTSQKSWEMSGRINLMPWMIRPPTNEEEKKSQTLAYVLEGEFPSYFVGKSIPEKPKPEVEEQEGESEGEKAETEPPAQKTQVTGGEDIIAKGSTGRIFVIGTAEILKDNILDEQGNSPNAIFLLNTIDYLNNQEEIALMRSKNQRFNPLRDSKAMTRTLIKIMNIAGLPALIILFGFYVWIRRKAKRRMIQAIFLPKTKPKEGRP